MFPTTPVPPNTGLVPNGLAVKLIVPFPWHKASIITTGTVGGYIVIIACATEEHSPIVLVISIVYTPGVVHVTSIWSPPDITVNGKAGTIENEYVAKGSITWSPYTCTSLGQ